MNVRLEMGEAVACHLKSIGHNLVSGRLRTRLRLDVYLKPEAVSGAQLTLPLTAVQDLAVKAVNGGAPMKLAVKVGEAGVGVPGTLDVRVGEDGGESVFRAPLKAVLVEARLEGNSRRGVAAYVVDVYGETGSDVAGLLDLLDADVTATFCPAPAAPPKLEGEDLPPEPSPDLDPERPGSKVRRKRGGKGAPAPIGGAS